MSWIDNLKQNVQQVNQEEQRKRRVYGEKKNTKKTLRKSYFSRPRLLTDWEYKNKKKSMNTNRPSRDVQVRHFSSEQDIDYDKPWNRLKYEHKINRVINFVKTNNLDRDMKKQLIQMTKSRKIRVEYENGEIKKILNLEEQN
jgi:hypothetical protein